jgi:hypothetical protein
MVLFSMPIFLAMLAALALSVAPVLAARGFVSGGEFGNPGSGNGEFLRSLGVAVNESNGEVYVVDQENNRVERFNATGSYEAQFDGSASGAEVFNGPEYIAIDNSNGFSSGDVYVTTTGHNRAGNNVIDKFDAAGEYIGKLESTGGAAFGGLTGISVDASGNLWVYEAFGNVDKCTAAGSCVTEFNPGDGRTITVDAHGDIYLGAEGKLHEYNPQFERIRRPETEEIPMPFDRGGLAVDPVTGNLYVGSESTITEYGGFGEPLLPGHPIEELSDLGSEEIQGIALNHSTDTIYATEREADKVRIFVPEPVAEPTIGGEWTANVASKSATLVAEINPRGASTGYRFEYDTSEYTPGGPPHGIQVPEAAVNIGEEFGDERVSAQTGNLSPDSIYYFRVVAENAHDAHGPVDGAGQTFTTQAVGGELVLPDGRGWELVSPPDKHGSTISGIEGHVVQASVSGEAITYNASLPTEAGAHGDTEADQVLSRRGPDGWSSQDISTPHSKETGVGVWQAGEYHFFSEDLSRAFVDPFDPVPLSTLASERTPYIRLQPSCEAEGEGPTSGCFLPLVTKENVPPNVKFGGDPQRPENSAVLFAGDATPDLSHVVVQSQIALTATAFALQGLYEWAAGEPANKELQLVSVLPKEEGGGPAAGGVTLGANGESGTNSRHAISSDGSRVIWEDNSQRQLYLRDTAKGETVRLDMPQQGAPGGGAAHFQTANASGTRVFFTDSGLLTTESGSGDLYECEIGEEAGERKCRLTDLTPKRSGESANVQGVIFGASEDGSYVYFVATGVLSSNENGMKDKAVSGANNLYLLHDGGKGWEQAKFIARLSSEDAEDWSSDTDYSGDLTRLTGRVSPDGKYLAFMSNRSLTGYDNHDANSGQPDEEVYLYKTEGQGEGESLICASCNPTGARPIGRERPPFNGLIDDVINNKKTWIAANVPGWTSSGIIQNRGVHQSRYLSDSGRLFFNSNDALVPQDSNGNEDVYEYEPPGVGNCASSSVTFSERSGGCLGLISSGTASGESAFVDASETGEDVFFLTAERLVGRDIDAAYDIYDAHVCSAQSPCLSAPAVSPPCTTADSCRLAPSPQPSIFGAPGSAMFSGAGNVIPAGPAPAVKPKSLTRQQKLARALGTCRKKTNRGRRAVCERRARKRYGAKQARKADATKNGGR